jgi:hypothetical protein
MGHNVQNAENALDQLADRKVRKLSGVGLPCVFKNVRVQDHTSAIQPGQKRAKRLTDVTDAFNPQLPNCVFI